MKWDQDESCFLLVAVWLILHDRCRHVAASRKETHWGHIKMIINKWVGLGIKLIWLRIKIRQDFDVVKVTVRMKEDPFISLFLNLCFWKENSKTKRLHCIMTILETSSSHSWSCSCMRHNDCHCSLLIPLCLFLIIILQKSHPNLNHSLGTWAN